MAISACTLAKLYASMPPPLPNRTIGFEGNRMIAIRCNRRHAIKVPHLHRCSAIIGTAIAKLTIFTMPPSPNLTVGF